MRHIALLLVALVGCTSTPRRGSDTPGAGGDIQPGGGDNGGGGDDGAPDPGEGGGGEDDDVVGPGEDGDPGGDGGPDDGGGEGVGEGEGEETPEEPEGLCEDTCAPAGGRPGMWANDGSCDDGGAGADTRECAEGTDCADCGVRDAPPQGGEGGEGNGNEWDGPVLCEDTCGPRGNEGAWADDGACDDGGPGAEYNECELGTDCTDCGPRGCNREHPCEDGLTCKEGECVIDDGGVLDVDMPECADLPDWRCEGGERSCGEIVPFDPDHGPGYWDYPLNGETERDQYRSYVRRDLMMLIKYATASVDCLAENWNHGNHEPLGLGDMSEASGDIPGTREGQPGHPAGTHVNGHDMDIGYYQVGTPDNRLRPVCEHVEGGRDAYHCVGEPTMLDPWRTALFIAKLHDSPQVRVIGVDGEVGPMVEDAVASLCANGWLDGSQACRRGSLSLAFETVDEGRGWYRFHHHHLHVSLSGQRGKAGGGARGQDACLRPGCPGR